MLNVGGVKEGVGSLSETLHLPVFELDRGEPAENGDGNFEFTTGWIDFIAG